MARSEESAIRAYNVRYQAKSAIGRVAVRAHKDHEGVLFNGNREYAAIPGVNITLYPDENNSSFTLSWLTIGGGFTYSPSYYRSGYGVDSRYVKSNGFIVADSEEVSIFSASVNIDGSVLYNRRNYGEQSFGLVPAGLLHGKSKREKIRTMMTSMHKGLIVAEFVERNAASFANRRPELLELRQAQESVTSILGEVLLEKDIAALIPPFAK